MDNKKKVFVKKQYHGAFGGTTKFEGRIEVSKTAVYLATFFFLGADEHQYGRLIESTENKFIQNVNQYPKTIINLLNHKQDPRNLIKMVGRFSDGIAFITATTEKRKETKLK